MKDMIQSAKQKFIKGMFMTTEERVTGLEGSYEHVATKADIARLEGKVEAMENRLLREFIGSMALISGLTIAILRFLE